MNKETTIYDLANRLSLSAATVSRALNNHPAVNKKTKKRIHDLAKQLGYRVNNFASNLRTQKTNTIGVIVPRLNSYFMASVIAGIEDTANLKGYQLLISQSSESVVKEKASTETMFHNRVDGLLVSLACDTEDVSHFDVFFQKNIPLLFFDRIAEHTNAVNILIDNNKMAYEATQHLVDQGCKRIIHVTAKSNRNVYADRLQGYKEALRDHRLKMKEDYIITSNMTQEDGSRIAEMIQKMKPLPDGIFVANDHCAVGCMIALKAMGIRIPEDIAIVGFNNDPVSLVIEPNLSTVNYPGYEMGQTAARILINHLAGVQDIHSTNTIVLRSHLIIRRSSSRKV
jgi:LacI family transcriptional regulator